MQKSFEYNGSTNYYSIQGKGTQLVLVHGFGEGSSIFDEQVVFLKDHCQVIVPDLPGSGASSLLEKEDVTIDDYADCIHALLQVENITSCIMLGHSMGGYITLAFAEKYAETLQGFGFIHSTAYADSNEKKEARRKAIEVIKKYGAYAFIKSTTPNLFSAAFKQTNSEKVSALIEKGKQFTTEALVHYYTAMMNRPDRTNILKNSAVPVLFIIGTEDVAAPLNDLLQQVHLPNISHIHILEGVGHVGMLEAPQQVSEHILSFVSINKH